MKKLIIGAVLMVAAGSVFAEGDVKAGEAKIAVCTACHGADGNSAAPNFPKLAGQHPKYTAKQLQDMKTDVSKGGRMVVEMAAIVANLSDQDIADIAAYYGVQAIQGGATDPELVAKGEQVYRAGNKDKGMAACTGCHSPDGKGNNGAAFPALAGQHAEYIEKQLKAFRLAAEEPQAQGARVNDGDAKIMRDVASRMSDLEIRAVASFISGLR
jgi:cbb3-type cytochrome c oxidase subunit III